MTWQDLLPLEPLGLFWGLCCCRDNEEASRGWHRSHHTLFSKDRLFLWAWGPGRILALLLRVLGSSGLVSGLSAHPSWA